MTGAIAVASIERYHNAATIIKAVERMTGVGDIKKRKSPPRSGSMKSLPTSDLHKCTIGAGGKVVDTNSRVSKVTSMTFYN